MGINDLFRDVGRDLKRKVSGDRNYLDEEDEERSRYRDRDEEDDERSRYRDRDDEDEDD
jgi:hypothetical protein